MDYKIGLLNSIHSTHYWLNMVSLILLGLFLIAVISFVYANMIDYMQKKHRGYKGEDFLEIKGQPPFDA